MNSQQIHPLTTDFLSNDISNRQEQVKIFPNEIKVFISSGCCKKLLQTWWFKTTEIYSFTVLETRSLTLLSLGQSQGVSSATLPLEAPGENLLLASLASRNSGIAAERGIDHRLRVTFPSECLISLQLPQRTSVRAFRAHSENPR